MSAEKIIEEIKKHSEKEIKEIKNESDKKKKEIIEQAKKEGRKKAETIKEEGRKEAENTKKILISQANQEASRKKMQAREEIIVKCFIEAETKLSNIKGKEYQEIVENLIKNSMKKISGDKIVYISREEDGEIADNFDLEVAGKIESIGGVVISSSDGKITIDNTFEGIIKREKSEIRNKVGKILFS